MEFLLLLIALIIALSFALTGMYLDVFRGIENPPLYWVLGALAGIGSTILVMKALAIAFGS